MILTPAYDGHIYFNGMLVVEYHSHIDSHYRIIEKIVTEDFEQHVFMYEWEDLNDIEKQILRERGQDIPSIRERHDKDPLPENHEAEIIPFPLCC